jgi:hypothetical protein
MVIIPTIADVSQVSAATIPIIENAEKDIAAASIAVLV